MTDGLVACFFPSHSTSCEEDEIQCRVNQGSVRDSQVFNACNDAQSVKAISRPGGYRESVEIDDKLMM